MVCYSKNWLDYIEPYLQADSMLVCPSDPGIRPTDANTWKITGPLMAYGVNNHTYGSTLLRNNPSFEDGIPAPAKRVAMGETVASTGLCHIGLWNFAASGLRRHGGSRPDVGGQTQNKGANYGFFDGHADYMEKQPGWSDTPGTYPPTGNWQNAQNIETYAPVFAPWVP